MVYVDKGCEYSPTCLDCPMPKCKHDNKATYIPSHRPRTIAITLDLRIGYATRRQAIKEAANA